MKPATRSTYYDYMIVIAISFSLASLNHALTRSVGSLTSQPTSVLSKVGINTL